jgi:5-formyltetrahydrofolate cyclo-ligase
MPKGTLRQQMLARRAALDPAESSAASLSIQQRLIVSAGFASARAIALYAAIRNEVGTAMLLSVALATGKEVLFPSVCGDDLLFRTINDPGQLRRGSFGIPEPDPGCPCRELNSIDLFVIPAVAFALDGQRVGYGKGYYDKALHPLEGSGKLVGICYDFQLVATLPAEPHDIRMDLIITETRVVRPQETCALT